jgi:hypothetical protein
MRGPGKFTPTPKSMFISLDQESLVAIIMFPRKGAQMEDQLK